MLPETKPEGKMEIRVDDNNFRQEVLESKMPVLVDFWAAWCGPCQMIASTVATAAQKYQGRLKVCKLNVDEAPRVSAQYRIMSIPTLAIFKNGEMVERSIGVISDVELAAMITPHIQSE